MACIAILERRILRCRSMRTQPSTDPTDTSGPIAMARISWWRWTELRRKFGATASSSWRTIQPRINSRRSIIPAKYLFWPIGVRSNNEIDANRHSLIHNLKIFISFFSTFTCNMHAFGLSQELCDEFLRKQCVISNLSKEQEKMLYDNINRMYKETAKWRKK